MKKLLSLLLLLSPLPVNALEPEDFYTYDAMYCMKKGECTKDVHELKVQAEEEKELLRLLRILGVKVYKAAPIYFTGNYRALYYPDINTIFINARYWDDQLELLRHESWHVAQDCKVGLHNSNLVPLRDHTQVPEEFKADAIARYGTGDPYVYKIEREALWAGDTPWMAFLELEKCVKKDL